MNTMPWGGQPLRRNCRWMLFRRGAVDSQWMTRIRWSERSPVSKHTRKDRCRHVLKCNEHALGITEQARRKYLVLPLENVGTKIVYENCFQPCPSFLARIVRPGKHKPGWQTVKRLFSIERVRFWGVCAIHPLGTKRATECTLISHWYWNAQIWCSLFSRCFPCRLDVADHLCHWNAQAGFDNWRVIWWRLEHLMLRHTFKASRWASWATAHFSPGVS